MILDVNIKHAFLEADIVQMNSRALIYDKTILKRMTNNLMLIEHERAAFMNHRGGYSSMYFAVRRGYGSLAWF